MSDDLGKYLDNLGISDADEVEQDDLLQETFDHVEDVRVAPDLLDPDSSELERTESFLVSLLLNFDPAYSVSVEQRDPGEISANISGGDPGKLIGRGGRTLSALEYVVNAVVNREGAEPVRVNVDVGGYKRRRDERLRQTVHLNADMVRKNGEPIELEPMSAAERRIIHMTLAEVPGIRTESAGEARDRRVVIYPD